MTSTVHLHARHPLPPFTMPVAAFEALDAATRQARIVSFAVSPCEEEESTVLAVWLDGAERRGRRGRSHGVIAGMPRLLGWRRRVNAGCVVASVRRVLG